MTKWVTEIGTRSHLAEKPYDTAAGAKKWLRNKVNKIKSEFADRHNHALATELASISKEIDEFNLGSIPVGQRREWSAKDDYSGVVFVFAVKVRE